MGSFTGDVLSAFWHACCPTFIGYRSKNHASSVTDHTVCGGVSGHVQTVILYAATFILAGRESELPGPGVTGLRRGAWSQVWCSQERPWKAPWPRHDHHQSSKGQAWLCCQILASKHPLNAVLGINYPVAPGRIREAAGGLQKPVERGERCCLMRWAEKSSEGGLCCFSIYCTAFLPASEATSPPTDRLGLMSLSIENYQAMKRFKRMSAFSRASAKLAA